MRLRGPIELPDDIRAKVHKATRLQRWSLAFMISCVVVIYFTLGQSQATKAVFIDRRDDREERQRDRTLEPVRMPLGRLAPEEL